MQPRSAVIEVTDGLEYSAFGTVVGIATSAVPIDGGGSG
jgi:hypothetical protein